MKNIDLKYICTVIGNLSGIPIRLFYGEDLIMDYSVVNLPKDPMLLYRDAIFKITTHIGYFITPHFHYYGIINAGKHKIVVGPTRQLVHNLQDLRTLAFRMDVPQHELDDFITGMQSIVRMPLESIMQMLCVVNYILNDEKLELKDIAIYDSEQQNLKKELASQSMEHQPVTETDGVYLPQEMHNTLAIEQTIENIIRKGDTAILKEWIATAPAVRAGTIANEQLRQSKNTFIVATTLASRAAIRGGMDVEDALSFSDAFIQKSELLNNIEQITNLQYRMILEYTEQVEKIREKTEEAKHLLCYTDKSILNISNYLGFSSQSHFSRVFKKYSGYTPSEYRGQ